MVVYNLLESVIIAHCNEQSSTRLWICQQSNLSFCQITDVMPVARPVALRSARDTVLLDIMFDPRQNRKAFLMDSSTDLAATAHFNKMSKQAKACNIRHRFYAFNPGEVDADTVQAQHT